MADPTVLNGNATYGGLTGSSIPTDRRNDFLLRVAKLAPFAAFLKLVPRVDRPQAEKLEWPELDYVPYKVKLVDVGGVDDAATTLTLTTGHQGYVVAGDVLQNPLTRETMMVTDKTGAAQITVERSLGDDSGSVAENQELLVMTNIRECGATDVPDSKQMQTVWKYNYLMHMIRTWGAEGRLDRLGSTEFRGKGTVYRELRTMRLQEALRELELALFFSQRGVVTIGGKRYTFFGGLEEFLRGADNRTYDFQGAPSWASLEAMGELAFDKTDSDTLWWFCGGLTHSAINEFHMNKVAPDKYNSEKLGTSVKTLELTDGIVKLVREPWFKGDLASYGFLIDKKCVGLAETISMKPQDDIQLKKSDNREGMVEWEGAPLYRHVDRMLETYGISRAA